MLHFFRATVQFLRGISPHILGFQHHVNAKGTGVTVVKKILTTLVSKLTGIFFNCNSPRKVAVWLN